MSRATVLRERHTSSCNVLNVLNLHCYVKHLPVWYPLVVLFVLSGIHSFWYPPSPSSIFAPPIGDDWMSLNVMSFPCLLVLRKYLYSVFLRVMYRVRDRVSLCRVLCSCSCFSPIFGCMHFDWCLGLVGSSVGVSLHVQVFV